MSSEEYNQEMYNKDPRSTCKYGLRCYQKNEIHRNKYKHPPAVNQKKPQPEVKTNKRTWVDRKEDKETASKSAESDSDEEIPGAKKTCVSPTPPEKSEEVSAAIKEKNSEEVTSAVEEEKLPEKEEEKDNSSAASFSKSKVEDDKADDKKIMKDKFLVDMPEEFYNFYEMCKEILPADPANAFKIANLKLVGPFDILNGKFLDAKIEDEDDYLRHWRYFYDPPEFQTIIKGNDKEGLHFGYWRDDPKEEPVFVAKNYAKIECKIKPVAETIFGAVDAYLEERLKTVNPFEKPKFANLRQRLRKFANAKDIGLDRSTESMRTRERKVVARTFHGAGIVVPYNKKTQLGYRELAATDAILKKILNRVDECKDEAERRTELSHLEEVERLATIAADECDFGTCLELGHDLFSSGSEHVQTTAIRMLTTAYTLLNRQEFLKIVKAHCKNRKQETELSIIV